MRSDTPLLGEWACLGVVYQGPTHGFAVAARLKPTGDVGRVWSLSRPLVYRSLDQLTDRGFVQAIGEEPGIAGGNRTILAGTPTGRAHLRTWLHTPVEHLRDLRSELLLKLVLAAQCDIDITEMLRAQRTHVGHLAAKLGAATTSDEPGDEPGVGRDVVSMWRNESADAALRFLDRLLDTGGPSA